MEVVFLLPILADPFCFLYSPDSSPKASKGSDDDKWKLIGGVVAVVAALTLGGVAIHKASC